MNRVKVESSQIASVGYDTKAGVLEVEFKADGSVYQYKNMDARTYTALTTAESIGSYFGLHIKSSPHLFPCVKVVDGVRKTTKTKSPAKSPGSTTDMTPATEVVQQLALSMPERAKAMMIRDNQDYVRAAEFLKSIKALRGEVDAAFGPTIAKANETHKAALAAKAAADEPLSMAEKIIKGSVARYLTEQEEMRRRAEQRLRDENAARIREQADAENLKRAQELSEAGDVEGAAQAVDAEVEIPVLPVHVESTVPKIAGVSMRTNYHAEMTDLMALVNAVAGGVAPIECLQANMTFLNAQARSYKRAGGYVAGVVIVADDSVAAGRK